MLPILIAAVDQRKGCLVVITYFGNDRQRSILDPKKGRKEWTFFPHFSVTYSFILFHF